MSYKVGVAFEVLTRERFEQLIEKLAEFLNDEQTANRKITLTQEAKTTRGGRKIVDTVEFAMGEEIDVSEFGIVSLTPIEQAINELQGLGAHFPKP